MDCNLPSQTSYRIDRPRDTRFDLRGAVVCAVRVFSAVAQCPAASGDWQSGGVGDGEEAEEAQEVRGEMHGCWSLVTSYRSRE